MNVEKQVEILNDLVLINKARIEGYQRGIEGLLSSSSDLRNVFMERKDQSNYFLSELSDIILSTDQSITGNTGLSNKVDSAWSNASSFSSEDKRINILNKYIDAEDLVISAYESALDCQDITSEQRSIIDRQQEEIGLSQDKLMNMVSNL